MPDVLINTEDFAAANPWNVANGQQDTTFTLDELLHAAITAGHDYDWWAVLGAELAGSYEMLWKAYALLLCVREAGFARQLNQAHWVDRFVSTDRFWDLDPSEKRGITYHLGILFAVAWARRILHVPWLLHIDVYRARVSPIWVGNSKPDLVGRDAGGRWVVLECKGRSGSPDQTAKEKAKTQSQRITNVGGEIPSLAVAFFSFFGPDKAALGVPKPWVLKASVIDPPRDEPEDPIILPDLSERVFFKLYYEPLRHLFRDGVRIEERNGLLSRSIDELNITVSTPLEVYDLLQREEYAEIPEKLSAIQRRPRLPQQVEQPVTDGFAVVAGDAWRQQFKANR